MTSVLRPTCRPRTGRTWTLLIPAPAPMWSTNDSHRHGPRASSANRVHWRQAGYLAARAADLPKGVDRVRMEFTFHFANRLRRDALNYSETAKPVIDGMGPPLFHAPTEKAPAGKSAPGWGLIVDDTPEHLVSASLAIGPLWRDNLAGLDPADRKALQSAHGGLTVVVAEVVV